MDLELGRIGGPCLLAKCFQKYSAGILREKFREKANGPKKLCVMDLPCGGEVKDFFGVDKMLL